VFLITGGARSGKSNYAEALAGSLGDGVLYLATAVVFDDEMRERVARHQSARPAQWLTLECHNNLVAAMDTVPVREYDTVLLDCLGNLVSGILFEQIEDPETSPVSAYAQVEQMALAELDSLLDYLRELEKNLVIVTNEVGSGIVPGNRLSRYYRDILGRLNAHAGRKAEEVVLLVSGIPVTIKSGAAAAPEAF
jgi:adenosylcobinamide kinase/adenosylcobinamide-phosphate guanylyltransferase